jgi:hypothetical protein
MIAAAQCAGGQVATGGGFDIAGSDQTKDTVFSSMPITVSPSTLPNAWQVKATYTGGGSNNSTLQAYVLCAPTS